MFTPETAQASQELEKIFVLIGALKRNAYETQSDIFIFNNADSTKVLQIQQIRQMLEMTVETWENQEA